MTPIRAVIVDDEPLARKRVAQFLADETGIEIVGECSDGMEAVQVIESLRPDLVFLDVQMPEMDGFEVLAAIQGDRMPAVVFATAFDDFALRAFNANAVDYLLKPFSAERFRAALERARARIGRGEHAELARQMQGLLDTLGAASRYPERFAVRIGAKIVFVRTAEIDWVDTDGNYVRLHAGGRSYLIRETLTRMTDRLPPQQFMRIHRSTVVNVNRIREIHPMFKGSYLLRLEDGTELNSTATYRDRIDALIQEGA